MIQRILAILLAAVLLVACSQAAAPLEPQEGGRIEVLAVESYLADLAANVAGERAVVETLMPLGLDPHAFEPTPQDVARIAASRILLVNGAGFEEWLDEVLQNAGGQRSLIEASAGLVTRTPQPGEHAGEEHHEGDPHFWLDPVHAIWYVENIRDGLIAADPDGRQTYTANAAAYIGKLTALDELIRTQVETIPAARRLLVTNHESFGYFADRYGFTIVGAVVPSVSSGAAPSAQEMADLIERIRANGAPAIFLETGANPQLAEQIGSETGAKVVTDLYTHSLTAPDGAAPDYIAMMKYNTKVIVAALK